LTEYLKEGLVVGKNFKMQNDVFIDIRHCWLIKIGDNVGLAPRVYIIAHDGSTNRFLGKTRLGKVNIGNTVFIGAGSIILPGVTIGNRVVIGAGSVVSQDVPDDVVVAGNPAKVISTLDNFLAKKQEEMKTVPQYGEEFTIRMNVSNEMKEQMIREMQDGVGYII